MYAINALSSYDYSSPFTDPRLTSSAHSGQTLTLDSPVLNGSVRTRDIYNHRPGYQPVYNTLADLGGGQISYYYDTELGVPFQKPLFNEANVTRLNYIDPMGTLKPHYNRYPLPETGVGLTWVTDTQNHRNEIMALNQWKRNQTEPLIKLQNEW